MAKVIGRDDFFKSESYTMDVMKIDKNGINNKLSKRSIKVEKEGKKKVKISIEEKGRKKREIIMRWDEVVQMVYLFHPVTTKLDL